jgi:hypothetical protein
VDLGQLQHAMVARTADLAPLVRAATLADAQHAARPFGLALAWPRGQRAYTQLIRAERGTADPPAPHPSPPRAPRFLPDAPEIATADVEALLEAVLHAVGPPTVLTERFSATPRPGRRPYGVRAVYPDENGLQVWATPFLLLRPGQAPLTALEYPDPCPERF